MEENPEPENDLKHYHSISEVASMFNISIATIRHWDTEFDVLKPKKNKKGDRFFTKRDLEFIKVIHHLLKEKGYTIEGAKRKMQLNPNQELGRVKAMDSLKEVRSFLISLKDSL
jgi:DNA-binding transcriptional MerR regulator